MIDHDAVTLELGLLAYVLRTPDFVEGVRARLIDDDGDPLWSPLSYDLVDVESLRAVLTA